VSTLQPDTVDEEAAAMSERENIFTGFRNFIMRGNVVDLAVAVVIGAAFGAVVTAFIKDLLMPLVGAIFGTHNFSADAFVLNHSHFFYGDFVDALIAFVSIAAAIYFFVVAPLNALAARRAAGQVPADADTRPCPECLSEIPKAASRCAFCTSEVGAL
jgi:large conductance mechanosensitive channel